MPSYNLHLHFIRAAFELAVVDRPLADSPAAGLKAKKPIRKTLTFEEFAAIVAAIRAMPYHADAINGDDFVESMGLAGLWQAEATALSWGGVDRQNARFTIFRQDRDLSVFLVDASPGCVQRRVGFAF